MTMLKVGIVVSSLNKQKKAMKRRSAPKPPRPILIVCRKDVKSLRRLIAYGNS